MYKRTVFVICVLSLFVKVTQGQNTVMNPQFYGIEEGLSHRDVQCIHQDQQGFMWFGTKYGLNRFDGYHFKLFTKEKGGLQSNEINHILEDSQGEMWLFETESFLDYHVKTITIFNPKTNEAQSFEEKFAGTAPFSQTDLVGFAKNEEGHLVFVTKQNKLITYTNKFTVFTPDFSPFERLVKIYWPPSGIFWLVIQEKSDFSKEANHSLYLLNEQGEIRSTYQHYPSTYLYVYDFDKEGKGKYVETHFNPKSNLSANFFLIDSSQNRLKDTLSTAYFKKYKIAFFDLNGTSIFKSTASSFWVLTGDHQFKMIDKETGSMQLLSRQYPNLETATDLFFDIRGNVWISTQFGIYQFKKRASKFRKFLYQQKEKGSIKNFACRGMTLDPQNNLWVMVENNAESVWKVNLAIGEESSLLSILNKEGNFRSDGTSYTIISNAEGQLYLAIGASLFYIDTQKNQHRSYLLKNNGISRPIWALQEDKYGKIWFANQNPGKIGYVENEEIHLLENWPGEGKRLYGYQFLENQSDTFLLATNEGIFTIDLKKNKSLDHFWAGGKNEFYLPFDNIHHIHQDEDNTYWLATASTGLVHWSPQKGVIQQFTRADGLPNNTLYAIYEDEQHNFWMSSDYGIIKFNKKTHHIKSYTEKDGITHNEFNRISHYQDKTGAIYFGSLNGVTAFNPKDFYTDSLSVNADLVITEFQQFDGDQNKLMDRTTELKQSKQIRIEPNDRFFRLEFALLVYEDIDKVQYGYMIEGMDEEWAYQRENTIRLSRLPYGNHTLRIKGQAPDGQWSKKELVIKILVLKPFYLKVWFLACMAFLFLASGPIFYKWRTSRLRKRQKELESTVEKRTRKIVEDKKIIEHQAKELKSLERLKSRFFANVSHELRTPLTLLLGPVNTLLKRKKEENEDRKLLQFAQRNAQQLLKLINEILDLSKLESGKLETKEEPVHLYTFLQSLLAQFHSFAQSESVNLSIEYDLDKNLQLLLDKDNFEKIIQNYLSNALKFTPPKGKVIVLVEEIGNRIQLSVKDTGEGIHPNDIPHIFDRFYQSKYSDSRVKGGTGIGLSLCRELAELLGGKVWVESEQGLGSVFYFKFPKKTVDKQQLKASRNNLQPSVDKEQSSVVDNTQQVVSQNIQRTESITSREKLPTILLVEDNQDLREYIKILLPEYTVTSAENGKIGLDYLLQKNDYQLIISDLMMPVMDGFEFLEKVKADDRWRHIPVIMLTAKANIKAKLNALRIGVDDYMMKPFEEDELKARIENLLRNYRERMASFAQVEKLDTKAVKKGPVIGVADAEWLTAVENIYTTYLSDNRLNVDFAANKVNLSARQFHRRLKQLTGLTPNQYLQEMRLQQARDWLLEGHYTTVREVVFAVGFNDVRYFSNLFEKRFGSKPSSFQQ